MGRKIENDNDIRKTVKEGNSKGKKSKNISLKKLFFLIIILAIIIAIVFVIKNRKINIKPEEISQYNYFIMSENGKTGVIDRNGKVIIKPEYEYIQIPNPEKDLFVCLYNYNSITQEYNSKVVNAEGEEKLSNYNSVMPIPSNNTSMEWSYQTNILRYKKDGKVGIITTEGKKVTDAIYDSIETLDYKDEILKVSQNGNYGLIKLNGEIILNSEYYSISADGYYNIEKKYNGAGFIICKKTDQGYRYGYVDCNQRMLLECKYNSVKRINSIKNDGIAYLIAYENGQAGLFKNSQKVISNEYESIEYDDINQIVALEKNGKFGVYDLYGSMILPIQYDNIIFAGTIILANKDGKNYTFDPNGNIQKNFEYKSVIPTSSKEYYITIDLEGKYGIIDSNKNILVQNQYSYIEFVFDKYFIITENEKVGLIDSLGNKILESKYKVIQNVKGTKVIQAIDESDISEIYNKKIEYIEKISNAHIYIKQNYVKILNDTDMIYLDLDGNLKESKEIFTQNEIYAKKQNGKWGFVDKNGNKVVDYIYDMVTDINEYGYAGIKQNGKWGTIKQDGSIVKEPTYTLTETNPMFIGEYYKSSADYEIDLYSSDEK